VNSTPVHSAPTAIKISQAGHRRLLGRSKKAPDYRLLAIGGLF
jgi:hypothetical protein